MQIDRSPMTITDKESVKITHQNLHENAEIIVARGGSAPHPSGGGGHPSGGGGRPSGGGERPTHGGGERPTPGGGDRPTHGDGTHGGEHPTHGGDRGGTKGPGGHDPSHGGKMPVEHGFHPGQKSWGPPANEHWGWQDHTRWSGGYDQWFFAQDPNYTDWKGTVSSEASVVANMLDSGKGSAAATELKDDLYAMRGDLYAQDELLNEVNQLEKKGVGADIQLNRWNADHGTWDDVEIVQPGQLPINVQTFSGYADKYAGMGTTASLLQRDVDNLDLNKFLKDSQDAWNNGTLQSAFTQLNAQTSYTFTDASKNETQQGIDQFSAVLNSSNGSITFDLSVVNATSKDGKKLTTFAGFSTQARCGD